MPDSQNHDVHIHLADAVIDAHECFAVPGAVAVYRGQIVNAGTVAQVKTQTSSWLSSTFSDDSPQICEHKHHNSILMPGLVNAHTHLDLTDIGYRTYPGSFIEWVQLVIKHRPVTPEEICHAVSKGVRLSHEAGVLYVGDISGTSVAAKALLESELGGVPYLEFFGIGGETLDDSLNQLEKVDVEGGKGLSFQPHAPYSTGPKLYRKLILQAAELGYASISTHLAETREEEVFTKSGEGPFRELLESLGKWEESYLDFYSHNQLPVAWLAAIYAEACADLEQREVAESAPRLLGAHCNYVNDHDLRLLGMMDCSVAYCPRASDYFEHSGHRYLEMIDAGINVCLGTDSIVSHGTLSILDEMKHLYRRDHTDPRLLLKMGTVNGYQALYPKRDFVHATFCSGGVPGVVKYELPGALSENPLVDLLLSDEVEIEIVEPLRSVK